MKHLFTTLGLVMALALSACASMSSNPVDTATARAQTMQIENACAAGTAALKVITIGVQTNKISLDQAQEVSKALPLFQEVCTSPTIPTLSTLKMQAFQAGIAYFTALAGRL